MAHEESTFSESPSKCCSAASIINFSNSKAGRSQDGKSRGGPGQDDKLQDEHRMTTVGLEQAHDRLQEEARMAKRNI